jgi:hypothetical protein
MTEYLITTNTDRGFYAVTAATPEMAYRAVASDYLPETAVYVSDANGPHTWVFTRELDAAGNLIRIVKH